MDHHLSEERPVAAPLLINPPDSTLSDLSLLESYPVALGIFLVPLFLARPREFFSPYPVNDIKAVIFLSSAFLGLRM